ncbi:MAG: hypothetical protein NC078_10240 [Ruminococcus sp.]|nr:hypothetical protein [Ruminococcus sp.]
MAKKSYEVQPSIPANAEEIASSFNYAVLSAEMGDYLKRKEQQLKNEYMNFTANCGAIFAEAQERLAAAGRYNNGVFVKWIESMGFKKDTVYRMINVHKFYLSLIAKDEQEIFDALPKYLQYDISAKSAPPELVEQVMNGDITTHAEYVKLKKELEKEREKAEHAEDRLRAKSETISELSEENQRLEREIKELESRPVDVAVQQDDEALEELNEEIEKLREKNIRLERELNDKIMDECFADAHASGTSGDFGEFYELLHANAISAIKDCANFIRDSVPKNERGKVVKRYGELMQTLEWNMKGLV